MKSWIQRNWWWLLILVIAKALVSWDANAIEGRGSIVVDDGTLAYCVEYSQRWPNQADLQFKSCMRELGGWRVRSD